MVQVNYLYNNSIQLPYAVGAIAAYTWGNETVAQNYMHPEIIYIRENVDKIMGSISEPDVVAFSCYVWNIEFNKVLAERIKKKFPKCIVIFGGHQVSPDEIMLKDYKYIDYLIHGEGEITFCNLLLHMIGEMDIKDIGGISYRADDGKLHTNKTYLIRDKDLPSPYAAGIFDEMVEKSNYKFTGLLETNRGCPYQCAYCDWGSSTGNMLIFPMERIKADLDWISKHKIEYMWCADANFGLYKRDEDIVKHAIKLKKETGFPQKFRVNFEKNSDEFVYKINEMLNNAGMSKGATLSFQSMNRQVLKNVNRQNIKTDYFKELISQYNKWNIPTYSELIIGLPGETYQSFCDGISELIDTGQHSSIITFNCEFLVNSRMAKKDYIEKFGIETRKIPIVQYHTNLIKNDISEFSNIIVKTNTMSTEDWVKCNIFSSIIIAFHCYGLLRNIAMFLHNEEYCTYSEFYNEFYSFCANNDVLLRKPLSNIKKKIDSIFTNSMEQWGYSSEVLSDRTWSFEEGIFFEATSDIDRFYNEVEVFLEKFDIPEDILSQLMFYQKSLIKRPGQKDFSIKLNYDFDKYFKNIYINEYMRLQRVDNVLMFQFEDLSEDFLEYAETVLIFGRGVGNYQHEPTEKRLIDNASTIGA